MLPPLLNAKWGHLQHIRKRGHTEYSAACPVCGDTGHVGSDAPDRFRIFYDDTPLGWCRSCGHMEFLDSNDYQPTEAEIQGAKQKRASLAKQEQARLKAKIEELRSQAYWEGYNQAMGIQHRLLWEKAGIPDVWQDYWRLGFTPEYKGNGFTSPALTIPYFSAGRKASNVQYRLLNPPKKNDKYRFSYGLPQSLWLADPDTEPSGATLLCEGVKKAAVTYIELVAKASKQLSVVAVPSKMPNKKLLSQLVNCDPVYIVLDPDAYQGVNPAANRLARMLGNRARFVRLPDKADD